MKPSVRSVGRYPDSMTGATTKTGFLAGFTMGIRLLGRGFRMWSTSPRLMFIGAIPGLVTLVIIVAAAIVLALNLQNIATAVTPFAENWDEVYRNGIRFLVM